MAPAFAGHSALLSSSFSNEGSIMAKREPFGPLSRSAPSIPHFSSTVSGSALSSHSTTMNSPASVSSRPESKEKKRRMRTSREQLQALLALFEINPLPTFKQRQELGDKLGMTPRSVQ
ncbi:hypothetical protein HDV03_002366, partial [Kappamyces sp. JEL0829]